TPLLLCGVVDLFFFSSRRRHTRCYRDWSSDVCSSDLTAPGRCLELTPSNSVNSKHLPGAVRVVVAPAPALSTPRRAEGLAGGMRSEERRVGKGWRSVEAQGA